MLSRFHLATFFLSVFSVTAGAVTMERSDKLTIVKFGPSDFPSNKIEEDMGWRLDCPIKTSSFDLPQSYDVELELVLDISGRWQEVFKDGPELADHFLAVLELKYTDKFGNPQFDPKMVVPAHFGSTEYFLQTDDGMLDMYGGNSQERKTINHGPMTLQAGAKGVTIALCDIAPLTTFEVHEIQLRFRPVN